MKFIAAIYSPFIDLWRLCVVAMQVVYAPFISLWRFFWQASSIEKFIIAGSVAAIFFILTLIALGSVFLLALNGYNGA